MQNISSDRLTDDTTFVAVDGMAARQLEAGLARRQAAEGRSAWTGPSVLSYRLWTGSLWSQIRPEDERQLLSPGQVRGLWRKVIEDSPASDRLIGTRNVVAWAMEAAQRLRDWGIDVNALRARPDEGDFASFLHWVRIYERRLAEAGWLDPGEVEVALRHGTDMPHPCRGAVTVWTDFEPTPGQQQLRERLRRSGHNLQCWQPTAPDGTCRRIGFADRADELRAAGTWAAAQLVSDPDARVAVVIPDLDSRREEVHRTLAARLSPERAYLGRACAPGFADLAGEPRASDPLIGSALTALELFSRQGYFGTLSRWLRSPFFATAPGLAARSLLEVQLRVTVDARLAFPEALRSGALAERIRVLAPSLAATLGEAVQMLDIQPARATPTRWVNVWRRLLRLLDWQGEASDAQSLASWEAALHELTQLTPVLGEVTAAEGLGELEGILREPRRAGPLPLSGVFILTRPEDVGPGYDGVWVSGLTDTRWPPPSRPTPILPLALQRAHDMPLASPDGVLTGARRTTLRLLGRGSDVVFSWPSRLQEYPTRPSPLIVPYPEVTEQQLLRGEDPRVARRLASEARHTLEDPVPPLPGHRVHGGAGTLDLQSVCPLRAFLQGRLGAQPLERIRRGLDARQRGIAAHRAMELLLKPLPTRDELERQAPDGLADRIAATAERALREILGRRRGPSDVVFELEARRLRAVVAGFITLDLQRTDFRVSAVEQRIGVRVADLEFDCRVDRLDNLTDGAGPGALAIIDYKTGTQNSPSGWLAARPRDLQLPLYTVAVGDVVSAAVIAVLRSDGAQYRGIWSQKDAFPGRAVALPEGRTWSAQLRVWREQLEGLAREFAAGDARLFESDLVPAQGLFAPLSRVYEQLALARGWVERWNGE